MNNSFETRLGQTWHIAEAVSASIRISPNTPAMIHDGDFKSHIGLLRDAISEITSVCNDLKLRTKARQGPIFLDKYMQEIHLLLSDMEGSETLRIFSILDQTRQIAAAVLAMKSLAHPDELSRETEPIRFLSREATEQGWDSIDHELSPWRPLNESYNASANALFLNTSTGLIYPDIADKWRPDVLYRHAIVQDHLPYSNHRISLENNGKRLSQLSPLMLDEIWKIQKRAA